MHPHVDSAHTDQDTPAESHTKAKEEGILGYKSQRGRESIKTWYLIMNIDIRKVVEDYESDQFQWPILQDYIFINILLTMARIYSRVLGTTGYSTTVSAPFT